MTFFGSHGEPLKNPYELLGLERTASDDDIAKSFKKLMLKLHPDKQPAGQSEEEAAQIVQNFHDVMDAKSFLLDSEHMAARRAYDSKLAAQRTHEFIRASHSAAYNANANGAVNTTNAASGSGRSTEVKKPSTQQRRATTTNGVHVRKTELKHKVWGKTNRRASVACHDRVKKEMPVRRNSCDNCSTTSTDDSTDEDGGAGRKASGTRGQPTRQNSLKGKKMKDDAANGDGSRGNRHQSSRSNNESGNDAQAQRKHQKEKENPHSRSFNSFLDGNNTKKPAAAGTENKRPSQTRIFSMDMSGLNKPPKSPVSKPTVNFNVNLDKDQTKSPSFLGKPPLFSKDDTEAPKCTSSQVNAKSRASPDLSSFPGPPLTSSTTTSAPGVQDAKKRISNSIDLLSKQFHCPLTKEMINEPMTDFEGNNYERDAILKYLETHNTSPVTGNPLYPCHLTPNSALKERIKYTLKLKDCLNSFGDKASVLEKPPQPSPTLHPLPNQIRDQPSGQTRNDLPRERSKSTREFLSLRESVDGFIKEINSASPSITMTQLDNDGVTTFSYLGIKFKLEVLQPSDNFTIQTSFDHNKKAAGIAARIVEWNKALQEIGLGGKLSFRNVKGSYVFNLSKEMDPEKFSRRELRHCIEYFLEMSIKLHNIINMNDIKKFDKIRLTNSAGQ